MSDPDIDAPPPRPTTPTTAERLVEYRDDLLAAGFSREDVAEMIRGAGGRPDAFVTQADKDRQRQEHAYNAWWSLQMMALRERWGS